MKKTILFFGIYLLVTNISLGQSLPKGSYIQTPIERTRGFLGTWKYAFGNDVLTLTLTRKNKAFLKGPNIYVDAIEGTCTVTRGNELITSSITISPGVVNKEGSSFHAYLMDNVYFSSGQLTISLINKNNLNWSLAPLEGVALESKPNKKGTGKMPNNFILKRIK